MIIERIINSKEFYLRDILQEYTAEDWKKHVKTSSNTYNRSKIFENENFEVYVITWNNLQKANIHDHSENGCWLKVLDGKLTEKIYDSDMNILRTDIREKNDISFMRNDIGFHSIENFNEITITLHIYSPPNHKTKFV